jgi:hypothetical protein
MSPTLAKKRQGALLQAGLGRLVTPIPENDPELDPFEGFKNELRRTHGAIRYYEEKIAELSEDQAFWGKSKETEQNSGEWPGTDVVREAKPNAYIAAWQWERSHLLDLHKVWIAAKMDERWLAVQERVVDDQDKIITAVVIGLGRDPRSPEVRDVVRRALLGLTGRTPAVIDA